MVSGGNVAKAFRRAIDDASSINGYVDWREVRTFAGNLDQVADSLAELLQPDSAAMLVDLAEYAIERIEGALEQVDDSNGEIGGIASRPVSYTHLDVYKRQLETGALARQVVAGQPLARDLVARHGASVTARIVARMIELASVLPAMERWVRDIVPGEAFCHAAALPESGQGVGLVEAARGSLGHWVSVKRGHIERYQIIAPTTWNFSPRDADGQPGPLERALVGLPAGEGAPPTIQHLSLIHI